MVRTTLGLLLAGAIFCSPALGAEPARPKRTSLTKAQLENLRDVIIPTHERGTPRGLIEVLAPYTARISDGQLAATDEILAESGIPPVAELLAGARIALVEQNQADSLPAPKGRELILTMRGLADRIEQLVSDCNGHAAFDDSAPQPANFDQFEELLWEMHVLENRLASGGRMAGYARQLSELVRKANPRELSDGDRGAVEADYDLRLSELATLNRELGERTMEQRLLRLKYAGTVLSQSSDLKEKFQAAFVVDLDGELLATYFKNRAGSADGSPPVTLAVFRKSLGDPDLPAEIERIRNDSRRAAGEDFLKKSRLLFTGLHWWYRGRYGQGTEGGGLLKSKAALTSPEGLFGLYMPKETALPTDPTSAGQQVPMVDRRHHYVWQFETRSIQTSFDASRDTTTRRDKTITSITTFDRFY
jgi:hypothetical protein